ncbi:hypothetical protein BJ085DRAFT_33159 [Dimargaris cristalligena]|uniref:Uncharacterized protein n=1 Tax=Dimargaris cristalligena TaxID=215637 RepID=A0A4Q0A175_9FUNG|nr:hypothetical protein BJ085DRAFT_33159 [Dimargaris cristalligena]|eukprot:RKP38890.1 hypothetical protein BJ085DRAFT_33159 [Dimargaris cristalligena]
MIYYIGEDIMQSWQHFIYYQFESSLFQTAYDYWGWIILILQQDDPAIRGLLRERRYQPILKNLYHYLHTNYEDPLFNPDTWGVVNPAQLSPTMRAKYLPLIALVDAQPDACHLRWMLDQLTSPIIPDLVNGSGGGKRRTTTAQSHRLSNLLRQPSQALWESVDEMPPFFDRVFQATVVTVLARLATTHRFTDLAEFMEQVQDWTQQYCAPLPVLHPILESLAEHQCDSAGLYGSFNLLAIMLAAGAQQGALLDRFTLLNRPPFASPDSATEVEGNSVSGTNCDLVYYMDVAQLYQGAQFLNNHWNCSLPVNGSPESSSHSPTHPGEQSSTSEAEASGEPNGEDSPRDVTFKNIHNLLPDLGQLHLTDQNEMGLTMLLAEIAPEDKRQISTVKPWVLHPRDFNIFAWAFEPKNVQRLRKMF